MNALAVRTGVMLIAVLLSSCVTPRSVMLDSVTIEKFDTVPRKVFVLSYMGTALPGSFTDSYVKVMAKEFIGLGSTVVTAQVTGLELDKNIHARQMEDFQPDMVMILRSDLGDIANEIYRGKIFLTLVDYRGNTEVWKSLQSFMFSHFTGRMAGSEAGTKFAKDAFQKLLDDRVFLPKKPDKNNDKLPNSRVTAMQ